MIMMMMAMMVVMLDYDDDCDDDDGGDYDDYYISYAILLQIIYCYIPFYKLFVWNLYQDKEAVGV